ncbi:MAG: hypothetical protein ACI9FU_000342 [Granulosicoccus sp.]|jgi:hypothetical protein
MVLLSEIINFRNPKFNRAFWIWATIAAISIPIVMVSGMLLPVFFLAVAGGLLLLDMKFPLLVLYIIYLPTNGLIPRDDFLVGGIGIQQVLGLAALIAILRIRVTNPTDVFKRLAGSMLLLLLGYLVYTSFKNAVFDMHNTLWLDAVKRLVNVSIVYLPILLMIRKMGNSIVSEWAQIGVFLGVLNMGVFCFLSPLLPDLGFYSLGTEMVGIARDADAHNRFTGVIGDGDSNTLGAFFVIACGFYMARPVALRRSMLLKTVVGLGSIGIALTASRTALLSLFMLGLLFFSSPGKGKLKMQIAIGVIFMLIAAAPLWETVFARLTESGSDQLNTQSTGNRIGKWLFYFEHFKAVPSTFIAGSPKMIFAGFNNKFLVAHNFYIQVIYNAGALFLAGFIFLYSRIFSLMMRGISQYRIDMLILPLLAITFFVSDTGAFIYFIIFLSLYRLRDRPASQLAVQ